MERSGGPEEHSDADKRERRCQKREYGREVKASAALFRPVSESSDGPLPSPSNFSIAPPASISPFRSHQLFYYYTNGRQNSRDTFSVVIFHMLRVRLPSPEQWRSYLGARLGSAPGSSSGALESYQKSRSN
ncbi:hypothetical protein EVAR_45784_1 [Eumeta japonica]|uniref:Uncharacterized protein n=1 Tax=Eumeta variegata TaxID=151549 RepID=A0A4C1X3S8_EUMVA|nr:hypothetical protein EVAR_45784_1 [Eumeta japonica]